MVKIFFIFCLLYFLLYFLEKYFCNDNFFFLIFEMYSILVFKVFVFYEYYLNKVIYKYLYFEFIKCKCCVEKFDREE